MAFDIDLPNSIQQRQLYEDSVKNNAARHAFVYATFQTTGWGCLIFDDDVDFGIQFSEMPICSYAGVLTDTNPNQTFGGYEDFPRVSGGVYRWRVTPRGLYTGCRTFACVELASITDYTLIGVPSPYTMDHHYSFAGIGVKMVPSTFSD